MDHPIVETTNGKLKGCSRKNYDDEEFYCFFGIPYIKPALGDLRFKAPQAVEPWIGIRDATEERPPFLQKDNMTQTVIGVEDAAHLNVYTKELTPGNSNLKPVMFWIYGGGFTEGKNSTSLYGPDFLLTEDIVLVTINYRLGFLGFISFEDPSLEVYGNAGLKDQVEALKWVQRNIKKFGGDPNNVTIFGESAGGASVHYLIMNPSAQGLFHKAIMQSGVSLNVWSKGIRFVSDFMKFLGKEDMSEKESLDYLRSLPATELFDYQLKYFESKPFKSMGLTGPILEVPNDTSILTEHPLDNIISGNYNQVPILLGYNSNECMLMAAEQVSKPNQVFHQLSGIHLILKILNMDVDETKAASLDKKIKEIYPNEADKFMMLSDAFMVMAILTAAKRHAETSDQPIYLYKMSLDAGLNFLKRLLKIDTLPGACHVDDCGYLFSNDLIPPPQKGTLEEISVRRFVKMWTNFAKYGNPTPPKSDLGIIWKSFEKDAEHFLNIDKELKMEIDPENERIKLWREIFQLKPDTVKFL